VPKKIVKKNHTPNSSSVIHPNKNKPEVVYSVKAKSKSNKQKTVKKNRKKKRSLSGILKSKISIKSAAIIIITVVSVAVCILMWQGKIMVDAKNSAKISSSDTQLSENTIKTLNLIGNGDNYINEIQNFSSAPESLQKFAINDYRKTKAKCIVNGEFIGKVGYKIENVVNDNYAKLIRICNGEEPIIVHYISGKWTILHVGNGPLECSTVNAFSIPRGVLATCNTELVQYTNPTLSYAVKKGYTT